MSERTEGGLSAQEEELIRLYGLDIDADAGTVLVSDETLAAIQAKNDEIRLLTLDEKSSQVGRRVRIPASVYLSERHQ